MYMETTSLAEVRTHLSKFVKQVHDTQDRVVITRNGEPAAVLISAAELEAMEETLAVCSDPEALRAVAEGRAEYARGERFGADELVAMLHARLLAEDARAEAPSADEPAARSEGASAPANTRALGASAKAKARGASAKAQARGA
jgi:antitoxin YefM